MNENYEELSEETSEETSEEISDELTTEWDDITLYPEMFYTVEVEEGTTVNSDELSRLYLVDIRNCVVIFMFIVFFFLFYSKLRSTITRYLT